MNRSEAGATLVEVLVAVMVLGVGFVALIGGFGVSIVSSDVHRRQAVAETAIRRYAEAVKAAPCPTGCASASSSYSPSSVGFTLPSGFVAGAPKCRDTSGGYGDGCPTSGVQVVKVAIASNDGRVDANLELVKRLT